tara:strand:- start:151 stop:375 length:225 start_codon:yes stop_codon:yes gene_type:complete
MTTKEHYLTLPYKEKLKALRRALRVDIQSFMVVSKYYLDASIENGGLPTETIDKEFKKGLRQKHYFNKLNKTDD